MRKNWEREIGGNQGNSAPVRPGMSSGQSVNGSDKRAFMKVDGRDRRSNCTRQEEEGTEVSGPQLADSSGMGTSKAQIGQRLKSHEIRQGSLHYFSEACKFRSLNAIQLSL